MSDYNPRHGSIEIYSGDIQMTISGRRIHMNVNSHRHMDNRMHVGYLTIEQMQKLILASSMVDEAIKMGVR